MFAVIWLLLLAAVGTAFVDVDNDLESNGTAEVLRNRQVEDGVFQLGIEKVAGVQNIQKRQSKSNLANPYIGDIYMITGTRLQQIFSYGG